MMNSRQDRPLQSSSLSTYIGYITGPRAEQPVGVRVVEPPPGTRQHQRGSLYAVVEVVGDHPDRGAIVDRLLSEMQRVYYSAKGSQSQVMVEAVQQTQQLLREINAHTPHYPMQLGVTCAALLGGKLLVASSGPAFALMRVSERVHMFPSEPSMTLAGYGNVPIEVYRQDVQVDDALFLGGGGWLRRVPTKTLASIVAFTNADNCTDAADELYDQAGQMQVPGLLIVLGAGNNNEPPRPSGYSGGGGYPSAPSGGGTPGGGSARPPASRRPRFGGLPTSLNTSPPARMPPSSAPVSMPPSSLLPAGRSSPPGERQPGGETRGSMAAREQSPTESMTPRVVPREVPPANAPPPVMRDATGSDARVTDSIANESAGNDAHLGASIPDRPLHQSLNSEIPSTAKPDHTRIENENAQHEIGIEHEAEVESLTAEPPHGVEAQGESGSGEATTYPYPISPLEEESFGGDLPVEPGDEFDPIFPPSTVQGRVEKPPRQPSWLEQWQAQTRGFWGRVMPNRHDRGSATEWEEISDELIVPQPRPVRPRYDEFAAAAESGAGYAVTQRAAAIAREDDFADAIDESVVPPIAPALEASPFVPPAPTSGARARLFLLLALVVVILVPVVVVAINFGQGNSRRAEAEQLTARAEIVLFGAQSALDQGDKVTARERLTEARDYLAQAIELDGMNDHRAQLIATIEAELQEVLQTTPLYGLTEPLITFPPDARPQHVLVVNDDIFVIDGGRQALLQYRFDPATGTVASQQGQVLLTQGDQINNVVVGTLADMAWLPLIPGFEDRPSLMITDRNNNVFRYDQRVEGATVMPLADRNSLGSIGQIQTYSGRVYLADEARGSILRYDPGRFDAVGEPWFSPDTQVNLAGLISMEIDGDIWLLFSNGAILRYREREQLPFSPANSTELAQEPTDMYVTRQESAYIYLVDAGQDRILVYDKGGAYVAQLTAPEDDLLRGLSSLYIDEVGGVMYILTQSGLFAHPVLP